MERNDAADDFLRARRQRGWIFSGQPAPAAIRAGLPGDVEWGFGDRIVRRRKIDRHFFLQIFYNSLNKESSMLQTRGNKLTWLGHAAFKIETPSGKTILVDPWILTNPMCPDKDKNFEHIDTMLVTHGHFDHIADAVELGKKFKPQVVGIYELCAWLESKGVGGTNSMNKGGTQKVGEIEVTMVNALHSCGIKDGDQIIYGGEASGYIIRLPGGLTIYHAGDTAVFGDMKIIADLYAPDLAMLPVGDHFTMGTREA